MTEYYGLLYGDEGEVRGLLKVTRDSKGVLKNLEYWNHEKKDWEVDFSRISYIAGGDSAMTTPLKEAEVQKYIKQFKGE